MNGRMALLSRLGCRSPRDVKSTEPRRLASSLLNVREWEWRRWRIDEGSELVIAWTPLAALLASHILKHNGPSARETTPEHGKITKASCFQPFVSPNLCFLSLLTWRYHVNICNHLVHCHTNLCSHNHITPFFQFSFCRYKNENLAPNQGTSHSPISQPKPLSQITLIKPSSPVVFVEIIVILIYSRVLSTDNYYAIVPPDVPRQISWQRKIYVILRIS